jgi:Fe-Mn family superoxide dismutase
MFTLPQLPYDYSALEPWIDSETMKLHHDKHHQTYVDNLNKALEDHPDLLKMHGSELLGSLENVPEEIRTKVKNNLGGTMNHNFFWQIMCPAEESSKFDLQSSAVGKEIIKTYESLELFKEKFATTGLARFGSGWVWLVINEDNKLEILDTANQDSPLSLGKTPILGLDVWEHAYYLKYQNRRKDYIAAWWNVVNWQEVENRFSETV